MAKLKMENQPKEVQQKYQEYLEAKQRVNQEKRQKQAEETIAQYGNEYEHAKEIFFKVNGARRILGIKKED